MPADQAEIHGIERHPAQQFHSHDNEQASHPSEDHTEEGHPPINNDPTDQPHLSNEQGHPQVRTSPTEQSNTPLTDEEVVPADNTVDSRENSRITTVSDST